MACSVQVKHVGLEPSRSLEPDIVHHEWNQRIEESRPDVVEYVASISLQTLKHYLHILYSVSRQTNVDAESEYLEESLTESDTA